MTRIRTTCTFCPFGCELEIVRQSRRVVGVEYPADSVVSGGRLCPRGSASAMLLDHPERLCYPLKNGRERTWDEFFDEVGPIVRDCPSNEIAVTYDRELTLEELEMVSGFAGALGTDNIAPAWLENDLHANWRLDVKLRARAGDPLDVSQKDILSADSILTVGDVFGVMPVISKLTLDARYADRNRRLFGLDSVRTRTSGFAHKFLWTRPATEELAVLGLAGLVDPKLSGFDTEVVAGYCGVKVQDLRDVAAAFDKPKKGVVIAAIQSGRTRDPRFLAGALQLLVSRMKGNKKLLFVNEAAVPVGRRGFGDILTDIQDRKIRVLLSFGTAFPFEYPMLDGWFADLDLKVVTATLRPKRPVPGWVLPVPLNLEKAGTASTLWGPAKLTPTADPASGTKPIAEIIGRITGSEDARDEVPAGVLPRLPTKAITDLGRATLKHAGAEDQPVEHPLLLLGDKPAYGFLGLFVDDAGCVTIHPQDARLVNIGDGDMVVVETASGKRAKLKAHFGGHVQPGTTLVDINSSAARALFEIGVDKTSGMVIIPPIRAKLWRSE